MIIGAFIAMLVAGTAAYLVTWQINKNEMSQTQTQWDSDQLKAIEIADMELIKHFPVGITKSEIPYKVVGVYGQERPSTTQHQLYTVFYSRPHGPTDSGIHVVVDTDDGRVISYEQHAE